MRGLRLLIMLSFILFHTGLVVCGCFFSVDAARRQVAVCGGCLVVCVCVHVVVLCRPIRRAIVLAARDDRRTAESFVSDAFCGEFQV